MSTLTALTGQDDRKHANETSAAQAALIRQQADRAKQQQAMIDSFQGPLLQSLYTGATSPLSYAGDTRAFIEAGDRSYDNAANELTSDFAGRGLGVDNSALPMAVAGIRSDQAANNANYARQNQVRAMDEQQRRQGNLLGALSGLGGQANGSLTNSVGALGGLAGLYSSRADSAQKFLVDTATQAAMAAGGLPPLGSLTGGGRSAGGDNMLGTNQSGTLPPFANPGGAAGATGAYTGFPGMNTNPQYMNTRTGNGRRW